MKKRASRVWKILGGLALLAVLLSALLQTPPGKELLAAALSRSLSGSENLDVRIGRISGWIPAAVRIDRLEIGDAQGIWLTAEGLECRWMMGELLHRRFHLSRLGATHIELHRFPAAGISDRPASDDFLTFRPVEIVLDSLAINRLKLAEAVAGLPLEYTVRSGGIRLLPSGHLAGELRVGGDAIGRVELAALLGGPRDTRLTVRAELEQLVNPSFGLDRLAGRAEATLTRTGMNGKVSVAVSRDDFEGELDARLEYARRQLRVPQFGLNAFGYAAKGNLSVELGQGTTAIVMDAHLAGAATNTCTLHAAATVSNDQGRWVVELHPLEIRYLEQVRLSMTGELSPKRLAVNGALQEFDLQKLAIPRLSDFTGRVGGSLSLSGTLSKPEVRAGLEVSGFASAEDPPDELSKLALHLSGELAGGDLQGTALITNATTCRASAGFRMPCVFSLEPFHFRPDVDRLHADLAADVDLRIFNQLAVLDDQRLAGRLEAGLAYDRTLSGSIRIERGEYEHYRWGVVVRNMALDLAAGDEGLRVITATATDGNAGRIAMTGGMVSNELALALDLSRAAIIRRDDVEGMLSGHFDITGPLAHPGVTGHLTVDRADILIDNIAPALPVVLTDYDASAATNRTDAVEVRPPLSFGLDVKLDLADQVYANASMIDSIWGGILQVNDVPQGVSVRGAVKPKRGYVSFIGKKFRFTDGQIDLDGAVPAIPVMNQLTAEYSRSDFTARLILNGRLDNPDLRLESTPAMPEDEVLSHVLFNRDTSAITPYQAIQIATAARQLSGGLNGPGFMYQMRQVVGVDTLEWREGAAAGDASSVAAGKYITPTLYIEVNQSLEEQGSTGMMAEYEVTRHFSVETSTGPKMRPGIGVNWKNDY